MIDLVVGAALALLVVRGWFRGFVREAMDLAGLLVGTLAAFRLSAPVGGVIAAMSGLPSDVARFFGGAAVFLAVGVAAALLARALERRARLPGLNMINRAWGAGLAAAWGLFVAILFLSLLAVLPMPAAVSSQLDESAVARTLTDPVGAPQRIFARLSGDRVVQVLLNLRDVAGARRAVLEAGEVITFPGVDPALTQRDEAAAREVFDLLNRSRVDAGAEPLAWSARLADVAALHAAEMYVEGYFGHRSARTGVAADRLRTAGIPYVVAGENLAIAATPATVHRGLLDSPGHRATMLSRDFRRVGVAVVDGPLGLVTVQLFTG